MRALAPMRAASLFAANLLAAALLALTACTAAPQRADLPAAVDAAADPTGGPTQSSHAPLEAPATWTLRDMSQPTWSRWALQSPEATATTLFSTVTRTFTAPSSNPSPQDPAAGGYVTIRRHFPASDAAPAVTREVIVTLDAQGAWRIASINDPAARLFANFLPPILLRPAAGVFFATDTANVDGSREGSSYRGVAQATITLSPASNSGALSQSWSLQHELTISTGPARITTTTTSALGPLGFAITEQRDVRVRIFGITVQRDRQTWVMVEHAGAPPAY